VNVYERVDVISDEYLRLQEISTLLIQEGNLDSLYQRVLEAAVDLMAADMGTMQKYYPAEQELRMLTFKGFHPGSPTVCERTYPHSTTSCGAALSVGGRVVISDIETTDLITTEAARDGWRQAGIRAAQSTPLVSRSGELMGMISTHWSTPHAPTERTLGMLDVLARQAADLIERTQVETDLRESEQRLRWLASVVELSDDAIISKNTCGIIETWNKGAERLFGYSSDEAVGKPITIVIPSERDDEERDILERIQRGVSVENYETVRRRNDGSLVTVSITVSPVKNAEGRIIGASKIARDVTERKRAQAREKVLMAELDHRVKNILARVAMVAASSRQGTNSFDEFTKSLDGRIHSMAAAHSLLSQTGWLSVGIEALVRDQLAPYASAGNIEIRGSDVMLAPVTVQALAMVLHELVTNAAKYGALTVPTGRVSVSWDLRSSGSASTNLFFTWQEAGGPPSVPNIQSGYGTKLIRELVPFELAGTVDLAFAAGGVSCRMAFPVEPA
jgi:PAS domain S-box-containing protein